MDAAGRERLATVLEGFRDRISGVIRGLSGIQAETEARLVARDEALRNVKAYEEQAVERLMMARAGSGGGVSIAPSRSRRS